MGHTNCPVRKISKCLVLCTRDVTISCYGLAHKKDLRTLLTVEAQPCTSGFLRNKLNVDISKTHWELVFRITKETKWSVLQLKILHNIYPTSVLLNKMGLAESDKINAMHVIQVTKTALNIFSSEHKLEENEIKLRTKRTVNITETITSMGLHQKIY